MLTVGADFVDGLIQLEFIIVLTPKERYKKESRRGPALEYPFVLTCKRLRFKKCRGSSSYFVSLGVHLKWCMRNIVTISKSNPGEHTSEWPHKGDWLRERKQARELMHLIAFSFFLRASLWECMLLWKAIWGWLIHNFENFNNKFRSFESIDPLAIVYI